MQQPHATDWTTIAQDLQYSKKLDRYWYKGRIYDERSANHNGIIGMGARLKEIIQGGQ